MKTNPDASINEFHGDTYQSADGYITSNYFNAGLTKREYFAAMAMQGLTAKYGLVKNPHEAVELADALIKELNKEKSDERGNNETNKETA